MFRGDTDRALAGVPGRGSSHASHAPWRSLFRIVQLRRTPGHVLDITQAGVTSFLAVRAALAKHQ
jgi:hypothetical protein